LPKVDIVPLHVETGQHEPPFSAMNRLRPSSPVLRRATRTLAFAIGCLALFALSSEATAGDWIYRRSYFTHGVPPEEPGFVPYPESRSAYRRAFVNASPGFAVRGGYRFNRIYMRDGLSTDLTVIREDWFQVRP